MRSDEYVDVVMRRDSDGRVSLLSWTPEEATAALVAREVVDDIIATHNALVDAEGVAARLALIICEQESDADRRVDRMILRGIRMRDESLADLRAQIAADIESARDHFAQRTGTIEHPLCRAYDDAALIARGESQ